MTDKQRNILIFGKNGQVGYELCRSLSYLGDVAAIDIDECDLTNKDSIIQNLDKYSPDIIANGAAYTAVDKAESEPELAEKLNSTAPGIMAEWAKKHSSIMVHYSTDYVFDGTKKGAWTEEDTPNPLNVYGRTKLMGDRNIQASGCKHFIFRTSWVYGARGKNFYLTMRKLLQEKDELRVVNDQHGAPTWCRTIADVTSLVLAQVLSPRTKFNAEEVYGIYNLTNSGETTWFGFTEAIREQLAKEDSIAKLAKLLPITTTEYPVAAKRPMNSVLSHDKLYSVFALETANWRESIAVL